VDQTTGGLFISVESSPAMEEPRWLHWARQLETIAQNGLTFARDPYDRMRFEQVREIAREMLGHNLDWPAEKVGPLFEHEKGYATPKVDVRGVVFRDGKILMVREKQDGLWTLPGGWADVGEPLSTSVTREIVEESGFQTRAIKVLAFYDRSRHAHPPSIFHSYKIFVLCEITGGEATPSMETTEVGFFSEDNLPEVSVQRTTEAQIHRMFEYLRHPDTPTDFD